MKMLFLHGLGQTSTSWNETISSLPKTFTAYSPNVLDWVKYEPTTYENVFRGLERYLSSFSQPVSLCGLSLGAVLALNYAIRHPKKVQSLVLIAPQYKMPKTLLKIQNGLFQLIPNRAFGDLNKSQMIALTSSMIPLNFEAQLNEISCPVLIVYGQKDRANQNAAKRLAT
ncbi:MAG: alpha/beta hydrolase, partial [Allobaculum sp.]|nr:alpha/beta hydrolase [Allobaculum sp.]